MPTFDELLRRVLFCFMYAFFHFEGGGSPKSILGKTPHLLQDEYKNTKQTKYKNTNKSNGLLITFSGSHDQSATRRFLVSFATAKKDTKILNTKNGPTILLSRGADQRATPRIPAGLIWVS